MRRLRFERWPLRLETPTQAALSCRHHASAGLFLTCRHWELAGGFTLELRIGPSYLAEAFDLIVWLPPDGSSTRPGASFSGSDVHSSIEAAREFLKERDLASVAKKRFVSPFDTDRDWLADPEESSE